MTVEILGRESSGASEIYPNVLVSITSLSGIILNRFFSWTAECEWEHRVLERADNANMEKEEGASLTSVWKADH